MYNYFYFIIILLTIFILFLFLLLVVSYLTKIFYDYQLFIYLQIRYYKIYISGFIYSFLKFLSESVTFRETPYFFSPRKARDSPLLRHVTFKVCMDYCIFLCSIRYTCSYHCSFNQKKFKMVLRIYMKIFI